jgi:hypothetical protein
MNKTLHTKYGNARVKDGYYKISSRKEGNMGKLLHRLIAADYFGEWINDPQDFFDIHHIDENPLNNCVLNLEPMPHNEHSRIHKINEKHPFQNKKHSDESAMKISQANNTSGYYRVHKRKDKECKQGFIWQYTYYDEKGNQKKISRINIEKLEKEVKSRGLKWKKFEDGE